VIDGSHAPEAVAAHVLARVRAHLGV
jgi:hypothetical protein